jgi:BMFP domain-containing protein YqiC
MHSINTSIPVPRNPTIEQLARAIHAECDRAIRRLDVVIRECDDALLLQAREAVLRAALISARELPYAIQGQAAA